MKCWHKEADWLRRFHRPEAKSAVVSQAIAATIDAGLAKPDEKVAVLTRNAQSSPTGTYSRYAAHRRLLEVRDRCSQGKGSLRLKLGAPLPAPRRSGQQLMRRAASMRWPGVSTPFALLPSPSSQDSWALDRRRSRPRRRRARISLDGLRPMPYVKSRKAKGDLLLRHPSTSCVIALSAPDPF